MWQVANWLEREIYDMMGIISKVILICAACCFLRIGTAILPAVMRRWVTTVMFSFNSDEISKHKPFAKE